MFRSLLSGERSREDASQWAAQWVAAEGDPGIRDQRVWQALVYLGGIDLRHGPPPLDYLHSDEQIEEWLDDLESDGGRQ